MKTHPHIYAELMVRGTMTANSVAQGLYQAVASAEDVVRTTVLPEKAIGKIGATFRELLEVTARLRNEIDEARKLAANFMAKHAAG